MSNIPEPDYPLHSPLVPVLPAKVGERVQWGHLYGSSFGLVASATAENHTGPVLLVTPDTASAQRLENELHFYTNEDSLPILNFPDWETLPYDIFSPHQDIISERLTALYKLPTLGKGIVIVTVQTLMQRLCPPSYLQANSLMLDIGQTLNLDQMRLQLENSGYSCVSSVVEHGEFTVRGSLLDLFPMGSSKPLRIELFDDEIESIRVFDPETQRSVEKVDQVRLLPAREFPLNKDAVSHFRKAYRARFEGDAKSSIIYRDVSNGIAPPGIEYYLPLFFEEAQGLFDYLPENTLVMLADDIQGAADKHWQEIDERYEQRRYDQERPLLSPGEMFIQPQQILSSVKAYKRIELQHFKFEKPSACNFSTSTPPLLNLDVRATSPTAALKSFLEDFSGRILFAAESTGRREYLIELLRDNDIFPTPVKNWQDFFHSEIPLAITTAPLEQGLLIYQPDIAVIAEPQLFGAQVLQRRRRRASQRDADTIIRNLAELTINAPVVHEEFGVGRYLGLQTLDVGNTPAEFLTLEYAGNDKLYVPVSSLHLISRYTGSSPETAPLHKLGSGQWEKARRKANEQVRDVAAELLDIYARREARTGYTYHIDDAAYRAFATDFPFEETPDQHQAIDNVIANMRSDKPMDHLVCGDVGFGKTEVAMRAAFIAVQDGKQVAVLAPTTLLTQQHTQNFRDRFSDWPVRIESLSRFGSKKEQEKVLKDLAEGKVDIVIGTHKLIQKDVKYKNLGLVIIDEEHRFGVRQKEAFKALRSEVDILTLTATPIPRTLNMAMSGLRDLSIIATAPAKRLAIKTFVSEWNNAQIKEACLREIRRGGQVYFVHNEVETIEKMTLKISELLPEATVHFAHGQMRERELEQVMSDFYHQRFNILVCTTIIETGIDIPTANTIVINKADRFGLAQLYQLRGRVGRSHHRAYAYLLVQSMKSITADAKKRLEAIESIESLGTGFTLATHDLEIRGAGELLGDEQSGQMIEIGYSMYTELLERAVNALKEGKEPELDKPLHQGTEIDLAITALIPEEYLPDVHERLILYKRISSASNKEELKELQVEMIDRFGLLPEQLKNLIAITELKLKATPMGILKIDLGEEGGRIVFDKEPNIDLMKIIQLVQTQANFYKFDGGNKLRISKPLTTIEKRFEETSRLLDDFSSPAD
ncbi:MAG: transcription-repair coupling factor [Gammaproteobacteria bacterium]